MTAAVNKGPAAFNIAMGIAMDEIVWSSRTTTDGGWLAALKKDEGHERGGPRAHREIVGHALSGYTSEPEEMRLRCAKPPPGPISDRELRPSLVDLIYLLFAKKYDVVVITSYGDYQDTPLSDFWGILVFWGFFFCFLGMAFWGFCSLIPIMLFFSRKWEEIIF